MTRAALRYAWLTYRRETLWFPGALLGFFVVALWTMNHSEVRFALARGYLGFLLPLSAGILSAYAILEDPALELRFATPAGGGRMLAERVGLILAVHAVCALIFEVAAPALGVDFAALGGAMRVQAAWLTPTLALSMAGTAGSLASAHAAVGAFLAGTIWLAQVLMKSWFLDNGRYAYLFLGVLEPRHPALLESQAALLAGSLVLAALSAALLRHRERYL